jgi:glutaredoxin
MISVAVKLLFFPMAVICIVAFLQLDEMAEEDAAAIQEVMEDRTGARTVPRVFVGGRFLGGGDDTAAKAASGELRRLLQEQGLQLKSAKSAHNIG